MSNSNNNQGDNKLNLNIGAKAFVPKSMSTGGNTGFQGGNNFYSVNNNTGTNMNYNQGYNPYYNPQLMNNQINQNNYMNNGNQFQNYQNYYQNQGIQQGNNNLQNNKILNENTNNQQQQEQKEVKKEEPKKLLTNPNFIQNNQQKDKGKEKQDKTKDNKTGGKDNKQKEKPKENKGVTSNKTNTKKEDKETTNQINQDDDIDKDLEKLAVEDKDEDAGDVLLVDSKEGQMIEVDETRQPVSIVFIGHVDHGKSTIAGNILILTGMVDERTLEKYQKEAKSKNRESWYLAYAMDINEDEREKGKTIEIGKAHFRTENKRFTILDAPGHSGYLPNMLQGACQADFAGLVISAKAGEFEAGFEKSGSTREHILLAKSLGVTKLVVLVNKMDEESVKWSQTRYNQIKNDLSDYLKKIGYNVETDIVFIPVSGLYGDNLKVGVDKHKCNWYEGPTFLQILDSLEPPKRDPNGPLRMTILDRYRDGGIHVMGKIESGKLSHGQSYIVLPSKVNIEILWIFNSEDNGVPYALPGESVRVSILF